MRQFKPANWIATIDFIKLLMAKKHLLIVLTGQKKSGKSTFIDLLKHELEPKIKTERLSVDDGKSFEDLVPATEFSAFMQKLDCQLLIIDNAHHLSFDYLKNVVTTYRQSTSLVERNKNTKLCLVADYSITNKLKYLADEEFKNFIHTLEPGKLTATETKTYILYYAKFAKGVKSLLSAEGFEKFYKSTEGEIANINTELEKLHGFKEKNNQAFYISLAFIALFITLIFIGINKILSEDIYYLKQYVSFIPPHYQKANMQHQEIVSLQKNIFSENDDNDNIDFAVIDKVIVVPKTGFVS